MAKLLLIEHNKSLTALIQHVLRADQGLQLVGCASNVHQALQLLATTTPDLILIDAPLPDIGFAEVILLALERAPTSKIILLADDWGTRYLRAAIRYGVSGCVRKDRLATDLIPVAKRLLHISLAEHQYAPFVRAKNN
ncbi:MAG: response regulator transcription factor [Chloroflexi bacterium]|nr:response regulator transcription factor [Chloroflexota bacterium]